MTKSSVDLPTYLHKEILPFVKNYHNAQDSASTVSALKTKIIEICYKFGPQENSFHREKSGDFYFDINPCALQDTHSKAQVELFEQIIDTINSALRRLTDIGQPDVAFFWQGPTVFLLKTSPSRLSPVAGENEHILTPALLISSVSEALRAQGFQPLAQHQPAFCFADNNRHTIVALQCLPDTSGSLSEFVAKCIQILKNHPDQIKLLVQNNRVPIDIDALLAKYAAFSLQPNTHITIVGSDFSFKHQQPGHKAAVCITDLDALATVFSLSQNTDKNITHQDLVPLTKHLLEEISFSHAVADHNISPDHFVVRHLGQNITVSRIDFNMINKHFTRGHIRSISQRPFSNLLQDSLKINFLQFVGQKNIGSSLLSSFSSRSKIFTDMPGIQNLFTHPQTDTQKALCHSVYRDNLKLHSTLGEASTQENIITRFLCKINHLPLYCQRDVLRDLKMMQLQTNRRRYFDFQNRGKRLRSLFKLLAMFTSTPVLAILHFAISPIVLLCRYTPLRFHNPIPVSTWALQQQRELRQTLRAASDPAFCKELTRNCLQEFLQQVVSKSNTPASTPMNFPKKPGLPANSASLRAPGPTQMLPTDIKKGKKTPEDSENTGTHTQTDKKKLY